MLSQGFLLEGLGQQKQREKGGCCAADWRWRKGLQPGNVAPLEAPLSPRASSRAALSSPEVAVDF